jgi:hypothetical protein
MYDASRCAIPLLDRCLDTHKHSALFAFLGVPLSIVCNQALLIDEVFPAWRVLPVSLITFHSFTPPVEVAAKQLASLKMEHCLSRTFYRKITILNRRRRKVTLLLYLLCGLESVNLRTNVTVAPENATCVGCFTRGFFQLLITTPSDTMNS